ERADHAVEIGEVVEEVVVAAGADPVAVAVTAQIGRDHVAVLREPLGDRRPREREIREAMHEHEREVAGPVPVEDVVGQSRRERDPLRDAHCASMCQMPPCVLVSYSSPRASAWKLDGLVGHTPGSIVTETEPSGWSVASVSVVASLSEKK